MIFGNIRLKQPKLQRLGRLYWHRMLPRRDEPHDVALSVAIGVFIGILPTFGVALILTGCMLYVSDRMIPGGKTVGGMTLLDGRGCSRSVEPPRPCHRARW